MKILALRIHNLNSLAGLHEIDFRREPLASAGLYAIVGPTGAGKSTILDAITLALYGKTDRDTTGSEVMSYGTGECFVEVEYRTESGDYHNRWERWRARKHPEGKLQGARWTLSKWDEKSSAYLPLVGERLDEVKKRTREVLGLDYDQFVRSVMLTQGQFSRFLLSGVKERAAILERITGTEIYSRLGHAAFQKHKIARETYERLQQTQSHTPPLNEPERTALEEQLRTLIAATADLRSRQKDNRILARLLDQIAATQGRITSRKAQLAEAEVRVKEAAAERIRLEESLHLQALREPLREKERLEATLRQAGQELELLETKRAGSRERADLANQELVKTEEKLAAFLQKKPAKLEKIKVARALEASLALLEREKASETPRVQLLHDRIQGLNERIGELERESTALTEVLGAIPAGQLADRIDTEEGQLRQANQESARLIAWRKYLEISERLRTAQEEQRRGGQQLDKLEGDLAAIAQQLTQAEAEVTNRLHTLENQQKIRGLDHLRTELEAGQPCPLCGSEHHPLLHDFHLPTDEELDRLEADLQKSKTRMAKFQQEERSLTGQLQESRATDKANNRRIGELKVELEETRPDGTPPKLRADEIDTQLDLLDHQLKTTAERLSALKKKRSAADRIRNLEVELRTQKETRQTALKEAAELQTRQQRREADLIKYRQEKEALIGQHTAEECQQLLIAKEQQRTERVADARVAREAATTEWQGLRERQTIARQQLKELEQQLAEVTARMERLLADLGVADIATAKAKLLDLDTERREMERLAELDRSVKSLQEQLAAMEKESAELTSRLASIQPNDKPPIWEKLTELISELDAEIQEKDRETGRLQKQLEADEILRRQSAELATELETAQRELMRWAKLNDLIGQQGGAKFSRFAQALTLRRLVAVGNQHLHRISPRYLMQHRPATDLGRENLELEIVDTYQGDNRRPIGTLSGGETFVVSLALALGLSDLASGGQHIQSLFIDEGFGTLDEKTLDQAVTALEQLEAQGKTVGLISHVKELQERIHCQIRLRPRGNGVSDLRVMTN